VDFGSATVEALTELLETLANMGATEIEVGRSDGSDLPAEVLEQLRQPEISLDSLMRVAVKLLTALDEVERVEPVSREQLNIHTRGGNDVHGDLGNLRRLLQRTGLEARPREIWRFVRLQRELMGPKVKPDLSQLRVLIKDDRFVEHLRKIGEKMKPLVKQKLAADFWVTCVWDGPNGMRFASAGEGESYGLGDEQLFERALKNFLGGRAEPELSEHGPLIVAQTHDCYDASLILDDGWCAKMEEKMIGELLACVPARNLVMIGGTGRPGTVEELRRSAQRIEAGGDHLISSTILVRRDGKWHQYEGIPNPPVTGPRAPLPPAPKKPRWRFW
jgi:hypothetical protein